MQVCNREGDKARAGVVIALQYKRREGGAQPYKEGQINSIWFCEYYFVATSESSRVGHDLKQPGKEVIHLLPAIMLFYQ